MNRVKFPSQPSLGSVLLITANALLGPALLSGLSALGWQVIEENGEPDGGWPPEPARHIVLVADGAGTLPNGPAGRAAGTTCIAVGSRTELAGLIRAIAAGADAAVDADQPFTELVEQLHQLLLRPGGLERRAEIVRRLEARAAEAARFQSLTRREREVLLALVRGQRVTEIAVAEHLSLPTVRSQVRSVLTKLNCSSQLAAVTATHRCCADPELIRQLRQFHQF